MTTLKSSTFELKLTPVRVTRVPPADPPRFCDTLVNFSDIDTSTPIDETVLI